MITALALAALLSAGTAGATQSLPAGEIARAVQQSLAGRLRAANQVATVSIVGRVADQVLPLGQARIAVGEVSGRWPRVHAGVPVRLLVDDRAVRSMTVWVEISDERNVMVYAADYPARSAGTGVRMVTARINMACCPGEPVGEDSDLSALRTLRSMHAGAPVMRSDFEPLPEVVAQQRVDIEVARGRVRLSTVGTAMTDGAVGDVVVVRTEPTRAPVHGRVVAKNKVRIDE